MRRSLLGFLIVLLLVSGCAEANIAHKGLPRSRTQANLLGTIITISIYEEVNDNVFDEVFDKIASIERKMSANLAGSEVSKISAMAGKSPVTVSEETYHVIKEAYEISVQSGGAFNLAVGPLVKLWDIATESPHVPSPAEIESTQKLLDYHDVRLSDIDKSVFLTTEGMSIELGAIAKGYAGDAAAAVVKGFGISHAILDLGGNIVTIGSKQDGSDWRVGIQNPVIGESGIIGSVPVQGKAVVTSGVYERYFESGGRFYHHILDSKTGYPADSGLLSVSIISDSSTLADKLSTAAFVLGLKKGMDLLKNYQDTEAVFVTADRRIYLTSGLQNLFRLTNDSFRVAAES